MIYLKNRSLEKIKFTSIDVDHNQITAHKLVIQGIPTMLIKKDGQIIDKIVGAQPREQLITKLNQYLA